MKGYIQAQLDQNKGMQDRLPVLHKAIDNHICNCEGYLKGAESILDIGCFDGYFLDRLRDGNVKKGFDINPGILEVAKLNYFLDVIQWDARKGIPYKDEKFDFINLHHTFEHIPRKNQKKCLVQFCDALSDDGYLCIVVPLEEIEPTPKHPGLFNKEQQLIDLIPDGYESIEGKIETDALKKSRILRIFICRKSTQ